MEKDINDGNLHVLHMFWVQSPFVPFRFAAAASVPLFLNPRASNKNRWLDPRPVVVSWFKTYLKTKSTLWEWRTVCYSKYGPQRVTVENYPWFHMVILPMVFYVG